MSLLDIPLSLPSKGRLAEDAARFLAACGLEIKKSNPRQYAACILALPELMVLFQRPGDALADFTGVPAEYLLVGVGADELINLTMCLFVAPGEWKIKQPYNVSVAASAAAVAVLGDDDYLERHVSWMVAERERLTRRLAEVAYLRPYPSQFTFVLCQVLGRDAHVLKGALEREGILVRYYDSARLRDHVRISIGQPGQNDRLIEVLKEFYR